MAAGGGGTALAAGLSRKLRKVLNETRTDSPELLASLEALSSFYEENTPAARRGLKSTIEHRALALNHEFLLASLPAQEVCPPPFSLPFARTLAFLVPPIHYRYSNINAFHFDAFAFLSCRRSTGWEMRLMLLLSAAISKSPDMFLSLVDI